MTTLQQLKDTSWFKTIHEDEAFAGQEAEEMQILAQDMERILIDVDTPLSLWCLEVEGEHWNEIRNGNNILDADAPEMLDLADWADYLESFDKPKELEKIHCFNCGKENIIG